MLRRLATGARHHVHGRDALFGPRLSAYDTGRGVMPIVPMAENLTSVSGGVPDPPRLRAQRLDAAREELASAAGRGEGGRQAMRQYSHRMDALIQQLFAEAGSVSQPVAVFALGGYGRRELCLHSDVDLLLLFSDRIDDRAENLLQRFLTPLWDLGLTLGHHVREVDEGRALADDNPEFLLALTNARPVVGDATLLDAFLARSNATQTAIRTLDALKGLIAERHARFNDTLYQLEPDVKESPGGLRDLFAAQTIAMLTDPTLLAQGGTGARALEDAEEFLLRARSVLHLEAGRHQNVLRHEMQERTAERLGYTGGTARQSVERFMSDYFRHARVIDRSLRWALRAAPMPVGANMVRAADGVRFVDRRHAADHPETWVALFQAALDAGGGVSDDALACVHQNAGRFAPDAFLPTADDQKALLALLKPRAGLYDRLSDMHEAGLLGQIMPEFKRIDCRVVRDFHHKYTVDEHTLLTIRNLERLTDATPARARFGRLLSEVRQPELLVLALLYHDIGKWKDDDDHAAESERLIVKMCDRLQLEEDERATVRFLVVQHLQMSRVAFRRDTEDPEIVANFATLVGTEERLKLLCLMTLADVEAVSRETLTPWKEELLWRLHVDTYNHLTLAYGDEVIDSSPGSHAALVSSVVAGRPDDVAGAEVEQFLQGLPRRYLQLFSHDAIYAHVRLARALGSGSTTRTLVRKKGSEWELTVITHDQPFLFSNCSGVLSSYGMDILRGYAFTKPDGLVVDWFHFNDLERFLALNEGGAAQMTKKLEDVVAGTVDLEARLKGREEGALAQKLPGFAPVIHSDNVSSPRYTIVEIVAENALGLLYRMSRAMSESGCDVDLVLISTEGRRAIDVFHLTKEGTKLSESQVAELTANLRRVLEGR
jgi:[protein-PII] uridylyltransferase